MLSLMESMSYFSLIYIPTFSNVYMITIYINSLQTKVQL